MGKAAPRAVRVQNDPTVQGCGQLLQEAAVRRALAALPANQRKGGYAHRLGKPCLSQAPVPPHPLDGLVQFHPRKPFHPHHSIVGVSLYGVEKRRFRQGLIWIDYKYPIVDLYGYIWTLVKKTDRKREGIMMWARSVF